MNAKYSYMIEDDGKETTRDYLPAFSCKRGDEQRSLNLDIENFLKNSAIFLIAQFGKNCAVDNGNRIAGKQSMKYAEDVLGVLQHRAGGGVEYLDCESHAGLIRFYGGGL